MTDAWKEIVDVTQMPLWSHATAYWINGWTTALDQDTDLPCWPTSWTFPG